MRIETSRALAHRILLNSKWQSDIIFRNKGIFKFKHNKALAWRFLEWINDAPEKSSRDERLKEAMKESLASLRRTCLVFPAASSVTCLASLTKKRDKPYAYQPDRNPDHSHSDPL